MKINHFQEVVVSPETAVSGYPNGTNECCVLIEAGDSFALNFSFESLEKLTDLIAQLQQIKIDLVEKRKAHLKQEILLLSAHTSMQVLLPEFAKPIDF